MIKYYFNTIFKNLRRQRQFSFINLVSLTIGIACCFFIVLYIYNDCGYDQFHKHSKKIYRLLLEINNNGKTRYHQGLPAPLKNVLKEEIPEVADVVRFSNFQSYATIIYQGKEFISPKILNADPEIFKVFDFKFIKGNSQSSLNEINSIVITKSFAQKVFGKEDPIGKTITLKEGAESDFLVTGIIDNIPEKSSIQFDCLCSFHLISENRWEIRNFETYILLNDNVNQKELQSKFSYIEEKYLKDNERTDRLCLQPLGKIHLDLNLFNQFPTEKDNKPLYLLSLIGLLILIISCFNYIILSTANISKRIVTANIQKSFGISRSQLIIQYIGESVVLTIIAAFLAVILVQINLPVMNRLIDKQLNINYNTNLFIILLAGSMILGFLTSLYPAIRLSDFKPANIFTYENLTLSAKNKNVFRECLIISQFTISIALIISTISIQKQLRFIKNKNIGYDYDNILVLSMRHQEVKEKYNLMAESLLNNAQITKVAATSYIPGGIYYNQNVKWEGALPEDLYKTMDWISVDTNFIKILNIKILSGDNFSKENLPSNPYLINNTANKFFGWDNPLGKGIDITGKGEVVGMVQDFNFMSLHNSVKPVALCILPDIYDYLYIQFQPNNLAASIRIIENTWNKWFPDIECKYTLLNEYIENEYNAEKRTGKIINSFALIAILLSCSGVYCLVSYEAQRRTKEIGIRKINGAKTKEILIMLNKNFIIWIIIAFIIALPIAWYAMNKWLSNFAYRTDLAWWIFGTAGLTAMIISLLTVSYQCFRAANRNPVDTLRFE